MRGPPKQFQIELLTRHFDHDEKLGVCVRDYQSEKSKAVLWRYNDSPVVVAEKLRDLADFIEGVRS